MMSISRGHRPLKVLARLKRGAFISYGVNPVTARYNWRMSESIDSRDPIVILQRALSHLKAQGKNVSNDDDVFELQTHTINVFRGMSTV
jgi:hypothetical protein